MFAWDQQKKPLSGFYGFSLSAGTVCALHSNVIIYSSLRLNTAVNMSFDRITLCPHSSTEEACMSKIKLQNAIEMAKIFDDASKCQQQQRLQLPQTLDLIRSCVMLILKESPPHFPCLHDSVKMLTFEGGLPWGVMCSLVDGAIWPGFQRAVKVAVRVQAADVKLALSWTLNQAECVWAAALLHLQSVKLHSLSVADVARWVPDNYRKYMTTRQMQCQHEISVLQ